MIRCRNRFVLLIASTVALCAASAMAVTHVGDVAVTIDSMGVGESNHGYLEHRVRLDNRSATRTHRVTLVYPGRTHGQSGNVIQSMRREVVVGPGSTVVTSLFQPALRASGSSSVRVSLGNGRSATVGLPYSPGSWPTTSGYYGGGTKEYCLLLSRSLNSDDTEKALATLSPKKASSSHSYGGSSTHQRASLVRSEVETAAWSRHRMGFAQFDGVLLTSAEFLALTPVVRSALLRYVECGGTVTVFGMCKPVEFEGWPVKVGPPAVVTGFIGLGKLVVTEQSALQYCNTDQKRYMEGCWRASRSPWNKLGNAGNANREFTIIKELKIPVRSMFLIVLFFAIAIGPVNVIVLARMKRKIWLLWTVPLFSILTSVLVIAIFFLAEGITPTVRAETFTILDERTHRATTIGYLGYYCPLTPIDGLHFGYDTEIAPRVDVNRYSGGMRRTVDWTSDQHLDGGWVAARIPAHFVVRKSEIRRERMQVKRRGPLEVSVVNGLGADIKELILADEEGRIYRAKGIKAGSEQVMTAERAERAGGGFSTLRRIYQDPWAKAVDPNNVARSHQLRNSSYVAVIEDVPFLEQALDRRSKEKHQSLVYGLYEMDVK